MVIKRSSSAEVARLIDALLTSEPIGREAAAARLAIVGARALDRLGATLQGLREASPVVAILDVLERIGDPRAVPFVEPLLRDDRETVVTAAIAVVRLGLRADHPDAAARATDALLAVAMSATNAAQVKRAAMDALGDLPDDVLAPLRQRAAATVPAGPASDAPTPPRSGDLTLEAWLEGASGTASPEEVRRAAAACGPDAPLALLHRAIERLRGIERTSPVQDQPAWRNLRGTVHQILGDRGSRVALYDLRESLERDPAELTVTMLAALTTVGDASCLEAVADAWARASDPWLKEQLRDVFRAVVKREALTRRHAPLRRVAARHAELLQDLSTPSQTKPSPRRARHI